MGEVHKIWKYVSLTNPTSFSWCPTPGGVGVGFGQGRLWGEGTTLCEAARVGEDYNEDKFLPMCGSFNRRPPGGLAGCRHTSPGFGLHRQANRTITSPSYPKISKRRSTTLDVLLKYPYVSKSSLFVCLFVCLFDGSWPWFRGGGSSVFQNSLHTHEYTIAVRIFLNQWRIQGGLGGLTTFEEFLPSVWNVLQRTL